MKKKGKTKQEILAQKVAYTAEPVEKPLNFIFSILYLIDFT